MATATTPRPQLSIGDLREKYERLAADAGELGSTVPLAKVCRMILTDLATLPGGDTPASEQPSRPQLLNVEQVAERLQVDQTWVYRHARKWRCTRRLSGKALRFDAAIFEEELSAGQITDASSKRKHARSNLRA